MTNDEALKIAERWQDAMVECDAQMDALCALVGVSTRTVRRMELDGELPPKSGRYWSRPAIERWVKEREK